MHASTPKVRTAASTWRSPPAFDAAYGLDGRKGSVSTECCPSGMSPYTSSVETWTSRTPASRAQPSRTYVPWTSVSMNSAAPMIERSTWVSAAKLTTASHPAAASTTASASQMSPTTSSTSAPSRFALLPEYVSLSRTTTSSPAAASRFAKWEPMNPAPPVTSTLIALSLVKVFEDCTCPGGHRHVALLLEEIEPVRALGSRLVTSARSLEHLGEVEVRGRAVDQHVGAVAVLDRLASETLRLVRPPGLRLHARQHLAPEHLRDDVVAAGELRALRAPLRCLVPAVERAQHVPEVRRVGREPAPDPELLAQLACLPQGPLGGGVVARTRLDGGDVPALEDRPHGLAQLLVA